MKTFKLYICIIFLSLPFSLVANSYQSSTNPEYDRAMEKTLAKLDSAKSVNELQIIRNQFERISTKYSEEWLPVYYMAYTSINMVYYDKAGANNEAILLDAKKCMDKLNSFKNGDQSEVKTLWGYYYTAMILLNPQVNGQKYFSDVVSSYEEAIELNPENPRPIFLLAAFNENLPSFIKAKIDFCNEMSKARVLLDKERKNIENPYWGQYYLNMVSAKCNQK